MAWQHAKPAARSWPVNLKQSRRLPPQRHLRLPNDMKSFLLIPLALFIALVVFLFIGLQRDPHEVPSPLINRPAPAFQLPQLQEQTKTFTAQEMRGKVWLLNVWATWCVACRDEHPMLIEYAKSAAVPIYGLNYNDDRAAALQLLKEQGNPSVLNAFDA